MSIFQFFFILRSTNENKNQVDLKQVKVFSTNMEYDQNDSKLVRSGMSKLLHLL